MVVWFIDEPKRRNRCQHSCAWFKIRTKQGPVWNGSQTKQQTIAYSVSFRILIFSPKFALANFRSNKNDYQHSSFGLKSVSKRSLPWAVLMREVPHGHHMSTNTLLEPRCMRARIPWLETSQTGECFGNRFFLKVVHLFAERGSVRTQRK